MLRSSGGENFRFLLAFVLLAGFGCATSVETSKDKESGEKENEGGLTEKYEKLFNPAEYNPSLAEIEQLAKADTSAKSGESKLIETTAETIPGFRIQISSTTEIDTANAMKSELSTLPESVGIYVIYDSPYYKVRIGDFLSRPDANQLLKNLVERGYTDAWIVADRVLKNPPLRKATSPPPKAPE